MEIRTQLAIVGAVAVAWGGGNYVRVRPAMEPSRAERMSISALEEAVARHPEDVVSTRVLARRYVEQRMPQVAIDTIAHAPESVRNDGAVGLCLARAHEAIGNVNTANAVVLGTLGRCAAIPSELAADLGCDFRTQTALAIEGTALERMIQWNITPITDPDRASVAHELATRPVRISARAL